MEREASNFQTQCKTSTSSSFISLYSTVLTIIIPSFPTQHKAFQEHGCCIPHFQIPSPTLSSANTVSHMKLVITLHSFIHLFSYLRNIYLLHDVPGTTSQGFSPQVAKNSLKGLLINQSSRKKTVTKKNFLAQPHLSSYWEVCWHALPSAALWYQKASQPPLDEPIYGRPASSDMAFLSQSLKCPRHTQPLPQAKTSVVPPEAVSLFLGLPLVLFFFSHKAREARHHRNRCRCSRLPLGLEPSSLILLSPQKRRIDSRSFVPFSRVRFPLSPLITASTGLIFYCLSLLPSELTHWRWSPFLIPSSHFKEAHHSQESHLQDGWWK